MFVRFFSSFIRATLWGVLLLAFVALAQTGAAQQQPQPYVVQRGDTLIGIAKRYGVDWRQLQQYNQLASSTLYVGQQLLIPVANGNSAPTPAVPAAAPTPATIAPAPAAPVALAGQPSLADFWDGRAQFVLDATGTGLPLGESDSVLLPSGEVVNYYHASQASAGVFDQCGAPVAFPGCVVRVSSSDGGRTFGAPSACLMACQQCPCTSQADQIDQQQYPRVATDGRNWAMVYEYQARNVLRQSRDGVNWGAPQFLPDSGAWMRSDAPCKPPYQVNPHPYASEPDCLIGGPPGLWMENGWLYLFNNVGGNPAGMGCWVMRVGYSAARSRRCSTQPLFSGAAGYGPPELTGAAANPYFDFRTVAAAEVVKVGQRYYMLYEGVRGPMAGEPGNSQFALGLARSTGNKIDGAWEKFPGNPILLDLPGNIGVGHADLLQMAGRTWLYTTLADGVRNRYLLVWR